MWWGRYHGRFFPSLHRDLRSNCCACRESSGLVSGADAGILGSLFDIRPVFQHYYSATSFLSFRPSSPFGFLLLCLLAVALRYQKFCTIFRLPYSSPCPVLIFTPYAVSIWQYSMCILVSHEVYHACEFPSTNTGTRRSGTFAFPVKSSGSDKGAWSVL